MTPFAEFGDWLLAERSKASSFSLI